jgi:methionyl-tRNA formyltransferase
MQNFRIVFMGTPGFATHSLKALSDAGCNVVGVITAPDKPAGRGQKLSQSPVKELAVELGIKVLQPTNLKAPEFLDELKALKPDLQVVVAFRMLPESVWALPPKGSFNLHASLLPQYRGAAPINWAVINGENQTGVSTFFLKQEIDTGNILFQERAKIEPNDTAGTVHDKLMDIGANLVVKTVKAIAEGTISETIQDNIAVADLKGAPKIFKDDCLINWQDSAISIYNKVRGLSPYPTAWTNLVLPDGSATAVKIFFTQITATSKLKPGETWSDGKKTILAGTAAGDLELTDIQLAGKKRMPVSELLKGFRWQEGAAFK